MSERAGGIVIGMVAKALAPGAPNATCSILATSSASSKMLTFDDMRKGAAGNHLAFSIVLLGSSNLLKMYHLFRGFLGFPGFHGFPDFLNFPDFL
eukprot:12431456-Karenia_brevis.AAC.1